MLGLVPEVAPLPPETGELRAAVREFIVTDRATHGWQPRSTRGSRRGIPDSAGASGEQGWLG